MTDGPTKDGRDEQGSKEQEPRGAPSAGRTYSAAFEAVAAFLIATGAGYWLDETFDTAPTLLLIGAAIGFASFTVRLVRLGRLVQDPEEPGADKPPDN